MKKLLLVFFAAMMMVACGDGVGVGDGDGDGPQDPPSTGIIYADEIEKKDAVTFTATQAWSATITDVATRITNNNLEWLQLSAYSGSAGKQSLSLSLMPNFTGESRKAEIKVVCGETIITIIVEQKATTKDNKAPQYKTIKRMKSTYNGKADGYIDFTYDDQQRVTFCNIVRENGFAFQTYAITYSPTQIVVAVTLRDEDGESTSTVNYAVDAKGRVIDRYMVDDDMAAAAEYGYDAKGYLVKFPKGMCTHESSSSLLERTKYYMYAYNVWDGPNIKSTSLESDCGCSYGDEYDDVSYYEYTDKLNNSLASTDFSGGFQKGFETFIFKEGYCGKKGRNLIKRETGTYTRDWSYVFDNDGNISSFSIKSSEGKEDTTESYDIIYN